MRKAFAIFLALALAGCASNGVFVPQSKVDQLVPGQTTRQQVIQLFGQPTATAIAADGTQTLSWAYAHVGFMGIGTKARSVSVNIARDGTVAGPAPAKPAANDPAAPMDKESYKQMQLQKLTEENLPYDQYQQRYKAIMAQ